MSDIPTKQEIIESLSEMIEVRKLQAELQELNTRIAVGKAEELRAIAFQAQMQNPQPTGDEYDPAPHKVTQEDLDNNPELVDAGIKVGEEIMIQKQKKLKKKK